MTTQHEDPFATYDKLPSVSWKGAPIGAKVEGKVIELPRMVQTRDPKTGALMTWDDGNARMSIVTHLEMKDGTQLALWCKKPSSMFAAIADAQKQAGKQIAVGGWLTVTLVGEEESTNPALNATKLYTAEYRVPDVFEGGSSSDDTSSWSPAATAQSDEPPF